MTPVNAPALDHRLDYLERNECFSGGGDRLVSMFLVERRDNLGVPPMPRRRKKGSQFALHNAVIFYFAVEGLPFGVEPHDPR